MSNIDRIFTSPLMWVTLAFISGIVVGYFLFLPALFLLTPAGLLLIALIIFFKNKPATANTFILIIFFLLGWGRFTLWQEKNWQQPYLPLKDVTVSGTVEAVEQRWQTHLYLSLRWLSKGNQSIPVKGKGLLRVKPEKFPALRPGDAVEITHTNLIPLPKKRNPGEFDYGRYLKLHGIIARLETTDSTRLFHDPGQSTFSLEASFFYPLRQSFSNTFQRYFSQTTADFLKALILGQRESLDPRIREDFQNTGLMHVLAISGLHVGFVAIIFTVAFSFLPLFFKWRNWLIILALLAYMMLTGNKPPVVRATLMLALYFLGINLERRGQLFHFLFAAALLILLFQPNQLFWAGFQFSFAAVFSILFFLQKWQSWVQRFPFLSRHFRIKNWVVLPLLVTLAAQLGTAPLTIYYFHKFSLVSFILNLVIIPAIGLVVLTSIIFLIISFLSHPLASALAAFLQDFISIIFMVVDRAAQLPFAYFNLHGFGVAHILLYFSLLLFLVYLRHNRLRRVFAISTGGCILYLAISALRPPAMEVIFLDVGQGDATLIKTVENRALLIDAGPASRYSSSAQRAILPVMGHLKLKRLHKVFISHPHLDHMGGLFELVQTVPVDTVYLPVFPHTYFWKDSLLETLHRHKISYRSLKYGDIIPVDSSTRVYVLGPFPPFSKFTRPSGSHVNNNSIVLLVKYRDHQLLFPGDIETPAERWISHWKSLLKAEVLKVAHHGSRTSSDAGLLQYIQPAMACISVGMGNKFGHPSPATLKRFEQLGTTILRTDRDRAIWLRISSQGIQQIKW